MAEKTYLQAISDGLREEMRRDKRVFLIGEDVGVYGGAFKVSLGFQEEFGPWRVLDAPLSETAIVGGCTGAGDHGHAPRCRDAVFGLHLLRVGSARHRRGEAALARGNADPDGDPLPSGGGFSGGPFPFAESRSPRSRTSRGLNCVCPATPEDAKGLIVSAIEDPNPVLFFEHKHPLPADQGRGAGRALHDADRQGTHAPRRATTCR
jgi:2-oxoisovalerate dehydrogenase E1 component beta subunit